MLTAAATTATDAADACCIVGLLVTAQRSTVVGLYSAVRVCDWLELASHAVDTQPVCVIYICSMVGCQVQRDIVLCVLGSVSTMSE